MLFEEILLRCPLFAGVRRENLPEILGCLGARTVHLARGQILFSEGDPATALGIVLEGAVGIVREDVFGNRSLVAKIPPTGVFAESYACAQTAHLPVSVVAEAGSTVLLVDCRRITGPGSSAGNFHGQVLRNLLQLMARKNLALNRKNSILSRRTTREKLLAFLLSEANLRGSRSSEIAMDRQALADFLGVDRSGLSTEIGKLRKEGRLRCDRNHFELL